MRQSQRGSRAQVSNQHPNPSSKHKQSGTSHKPTCSLGAACTDPWCSKACLDPNCQDPNCSRNIGRMSYEKESAVMPNLVTLVCDNCSRSDVLLMKCDRCNLVTYCNTECQIKAWTKGHKDQCVPPNNRLHFKMIPPKGTYTKKPHCLFPSFSDLPHEGIDIRSVLSDLIQLNISKANDCDAGDNVIVVAKTKISIKKNKSNTNDNNTKNHGHLDNIPDNDCRYCKQSTFFPLIRTLVLGLSERAGLVYLDYKKLVDDYYAQVPKNLQVAFMFECHRWATIRFGWSLLSETNAKEIIELTLLKHSNPKRIVSMGSGCGYAEHMLSNALRKLERHLDVFAFDLNSPKERGNFDVEVKVGGVDSFRALAPLDDAVLLLCWPPFGSRSEEQSRMAFDTLSLFKELGGRYLIYIGDFDSTGDWRYHILLRNEWKLYPETFDFTPMENWIPEKMALVNAGNDSIGVYCHRDAL